MSFMKASSVELYYDIQKQLLHFLECKHRETLITFASFIKGNGMLTKKKNLVINTAFV